MSGSLPLRIMISSLPHLTREQSHDQPKDMWKDKKGGSSNQLFHVNEPLFHDGGYKANKVIEFFKKETSK